MLTAKPVPQSPHREPQASARLNAARAAELKITPPNPNLALRRYVTSSGSGSLSFDSASWASSVAGNASWATASWADASWADASWSSASWADASWSAASWADASWADASWADASWADASWADSSYEDAAEGDAAASPPAMSADVYAELQSDPYLALPLALLP